MRTAKRIEQLPPYLFYEINKRIAEKRAKGEDIISFAIGDPDLPTPDHIIESLTEAAHVPANHRYPESDSLPELRKAVADWYVRRFGLTFDPDKEVLPLIGSKEGIAHIALCFIDPGDVALVPDPGYPVYSIGTMFAGGESYYLPLKEENGFLPDLDAVPARVWRDVQLLVLCSPGNPTGAILPRGYLEEALALAERYDFVIASDECYADLWLDEARPPPSLLEAARATGRTRYERCIVFHSLSKRSSVPGLRSGFVAGDPRIIAEFLRYRTYHGCAMALPTQLASVAAWDDDAHAAANRALYREKFARVVPMLAPVLDVAAPEGGFYLWPDVRENDTVFTRELFATQNLTILPGSYLAREAQGANPGAQRVRISLVAGVDECAEAARRIRAFLETR